MSAAFANYGEEKRLPNSVMARLLYLQECFLLLLLLLLERSLGLGWGWMRLSFRRPKGEGHCELLLANFHSLKYQVESLSQPFLLVIGSWLDICIPVDELLITERAAARKMACWLFQFIHFVLRQLTQPLTGRGLPGRRFDDNRVLIFSYQKNK